MNNWRGWRKQSSITGRTISSKSQDREGNVLSLTELAGRAAQLEAEHYDSSPIPGSCYDTASESVEPEQTD